MHDDDRARRPSVRLEIPEPDIAIVALGGEHDLSSKAELGEALGRAGEHRFVLVDLSDCSFLDSTVLGLLLVTCQRMWERDGRLELVVPRDTAVVLRVIKIAGLTTILTIHETREEGLASLRTQE